MRALLCCTFVAVVAVTGVLLAQSAEKEDAMHGSAWEKLIGAWHLVSMEEPGADGKVLRITKRMECWSTRAMGICRCRLCSESDLSNDEQSRTHHVQGSIIPRLVGKDLARVYQFSDGHLIIKSSHPEEHWSVTWEHF